MINLDKIPKGVLYHLYGYLDLKSLNNAQIAISNFARDEPEDTYLVTSYKNEYYVRTLLHKYIEEYYQSNSLIMGHIREPCSKWCINRITYAYAQQSFFILKKAHQKKLNESYDGYKKYQQLLNQNWNKPARLIVFPHNIYIGYILIIDLDYKFHIVKDARYYVNPQSNLQIGSIEETFKDKEILNISVTSNSEFYVLTSDRDIYVWGHQMAHRHWMKPLLYYDHMISCPLHMDGNIIIDYQCRVWLDNINCLFALRGIKYFMDQMKTDKMPQTLHRPHYLYEIKEDVYTAIVEMDKRRIRYWTSEGQEKFLEFTHKIKIKNGFHQYIYEEGLETDRYFDLNISRIIGKTDF
jgi:hypothetical protein